MFSELKVQLRNELQFVELSEVCSANKQFVQLRTGLSLAFELAIYSYLSDLTS